MTLETIQNICNRLPDVTEDIKWENHVCFNTGGKMFVITAPDESPVSASFKTTEDKFNELKEREGFKPAPYLARYNWIWLDDINRMKYDEWLELINMSYKLVQSKLTRKKSVINNFNIKQ